MFKFIEKIMSIGFLCYALFYITAINRDFQHTEYLEKCLFGIIPIFVALFLVESFDETLAKRLKSWPQLRKVIRWAGQWSAQGFAQYVLMFCLPFFLMGDHYIQLSITTLVLASTVWDSWFRRLFEVELYRIMLRFWCVICGFSFMWPFLAPNYVGSFYTALSIVGCMALIPRTLSKKSIFQSLLLMVLLFVNSWLLPTDMRFPILSIWMEKPYFAIKPARSTELKPIVDTLRLADYRKYLSTGHTLCCVSPIVAPPKVREKITLEWSVDGDFVERPELKNIIIGNKKQRAFRTHFCKRNFPRMKVGAEINCFATIQNKLFVGEVDLQITK